LFSVSVVFWIALSSAVCLMASLSRRPNWVSAVREAAASVAAARRAGSGVMGRRIDI
jgi:hypothetical protein